MSSDAILASLGIDQLISEREFDREPQTGVLRNPAGIRVVGAPAQLLRSLRLILEKENPSAWHSVLKATGEAAGKSIATRLDAKLVQLDKPTLNALPLEACLALIERYLGVHGWGLVTFDLDDAADHGLVVARLQHSCFAEALSEVDDFVDPLLAGLLRGFIEHISGESLGCAEIACERQLGATAAATPGCTFVITAQERLDAVASLFGHESADAIIERLKT